MPTDTERLEALGYYLTIEDEKTGQIEGGRKRLRLTATKKYVIMVSIDDELDCSPTGRAMAIEFGAKGLLKEITKEADYEKSSAGNRT